MPQYKSKLAWFAGSLIVLGLIYFLSTQFLQDENEGIIKHKDKLPVPVEVASLERKTLYLHRTFNGTIEPLAQFTVAPKVSGRIQRLFVDVSDPVKRGQIVAQLEDAEFNQSVAEAEARLAVAEANRIEADSSMEITQRELDRTITLHKKGIASDSVLDSARAEHLASQATVKVAEASLKQEEAALAAARIRLGYTRIQADWEKGDDERTVAERYVDEGDTVAANTPLLSIVELDPVIAVIQVTEKDYPRIAKGMAAQQAARQIGVSEQTYYRWRKEYGGMQVEQAKRLKVLEKENIRLKRLVAEKELDIQILKEAIAFESKNF